VYAHSLTGVQLHRVDHFSTTSSLYWEASPANIGHLAQSKVEAILREEVASYSKDKVSDQDGSVLFMKGYNVSGCTVRSSGGGESDAVHVLTTAVGCTPDTKHLQHDIECRFLVGADGANSTVRKMLGIPMVGEEAMQHLVNVHFTCPGLRAKLLPRSGMLYFIFNEVRTTLSLHHCAFTCVRCVQAHLDYSFALHVLTIIHFKILPLSLVVNFDYLLVAIAYVRCGTDILCLLVLLSSVNSSFDRRWSVCSLRTTWHRTSGCAKSPTFLPSKH
jgi:hypothetical protein